MYESGVDVIPPQCSSHFRVELVTNERKAESQGFVRLPPPVPLVVARFLQGRSYCLCWVAIVGEFVDCSLNGVRSVFRAAVPDCSLDFIGNDCSLDRVWVM